MKKNEDNDIERWKKIMSKEEFASKFPIENMKIELILNINKFSNKVKNKNKYENNSNK